MNPDILQNPGKLVWSGAHWINAIREHGDAIYSGLIEWAVANAGAENILFGTDTPLYSASAHRARIDGAEITDDQKRLILRDNAERLLPLPGRDN
jgi:predicted TIM-barrel fold metal-dependent hydrolase